MKRINMLNAISRIEEVSQAPNDIVIPDTERSTVAQPQQLRSNKLFTGMNSNTSIKTNKWANPRDTKMAAKLLFNIKEPNRLEKLFNESNLRSSPRINNEQATNENHAAMST